MKRALVFIVVLSQAMAQVIASTAFASRPSSANGANGLAGASTQSATFVDHLVRTLANQSTLEGLQARALSASATEEERACLRNVFSVASQVRSEFSAKEGQILLHNEALPVALNFDAGGALQVQIDGTQFNGSQATCLNVRAALIASGERRVAAAANQGQQRSLTARLNPVQPAQALIPLGLAPWLIMGSVAAILGSFQLNLYLESRTGKGWIEAAAAATNFRGESDRNSLYIAAINCPAASQAVVTPQNHLPSFAEVTQAAMQFYCVNERRMDASAANFRAECAVALIELENAEDGKMSDVIHQAYRATARRLDPSSTERVTLSWLPSGDLTLRSAGGDGMLKAFRAPRSQTGPGGRPIVEVAYRFISDSGSEISEAYLAYDRIRGFILSNIAFSARENCATRNANWLQAFVRQFNDQPLSQANPRELLSSDLFRN